MSAIVFQHIQPCISDLTIRGSNRLNLFAKRMPLTKLSFPLADLLADSIQRMETARCSNKWDDKLSCVEEKNVLHLTPLVKDHLSNVLKNQNRSPDLLNLEAILVSVKLLSKVKLEGVDQETLAREWVQKAREAIQKLDISKSEPLKLLDDLVLVQVNNKQTKVIVDKVIKLVSS